MPRILSVAILGLFGLGAAGYAAEREVVGKSGGDGGHRWEFDGKVSGKAAVGKADNRLQVKVKNGDVVRFKVDGGTHGVLFEKAKSEMGAGVWEVVKDSGTLKELPPRQHSTGSIARTPGPRMRMGLGTCSLR